jgi:hypothetical protein
VAIDSDELRELRRRARAHWPVVRTSLDTESADDLSETTTPAERIGMMWTLAESAWLLAGLRLPTYDRSTIPAVLYRPDAPPPDSDDA